VATGPFFFGRRPGIGRPALEAGLLAAMLAHFSADIVLHVLVLLLMLLAARS